ncbi:hypothetical protein ACFE04_004479 [Oxalis oulophora]
MPTNNDGSSSYNVVPTSRRNQQVQHCVTYPSNDSMGHLSSNARNRSRSRKTTRGDGFPFYDVVAPLSTNQACMSFSSSDVSGPSNSNARNRSRIRIINKQLSSTLETHFLGKPDKICLRCASLNWFGEKTNKCSFR